MAWHSFDKHNSTADVCFPNSAVHAALCAGAVLEAHYGDVALDTFGRIAGRYVTIMEPQSVDVPLASWLHFEYGELDLSVVSEIAAGLVPSIFDTLVRAWPMGTNTIMKERLGQRLARQLDILAFSRAKSARLLVPRSTVLQTWFRFSPRLALLRLQHASEGDWTAIERALPSLNQSAALREALDAELDWCRAPGALADLPVFNPLSRSSAHLTGLVRSNDGQGIGTIVPISRALR